MLDLRRIHALRHECRCVVQTAARLLAAASKSAPAAPLPADGGEGLGLLPWPKVDFAKFGPVERQEMPAVSRRSAAANLHRNCHPDPALSRTTTMPTSRTWRRSASLTNKENEKSGVKVTMLAFLIKACVAALKRFPEFNSSPRRRSAVVLQAATYHIGFAADTPQGLMVPVIKDADTKGVLQISARDVRTWRRKPVTASCPLADMSGASFTISSLGGIGGRYFTPDHQCTWRLRFWAFAGPRCSRSGTASVFEPRLMLPLSFELGPPGHRWRRCGTFQCLSGPDPRRFPPGSVVTTVVVVKKAGQVAIAADTLVTFGDTRLSHRYEANSKLFKVDTPTGPSWVGMAGTVAHFPVLRKAMNALPKDQLLLGSRDEVFDTFVKLHPLLKESFFLQTKEDDNDPYESSQFSVVIANASGIFGLYSYREVFEFKEFWGIGSGRGFALGAMHAVWDKARSAREVALAGIHAGCEFDRSSAGPVDIYTIKLKT
jgi:ATP-dependent HslUV protease subunit HslV